MSVRQVHHRNPPPPLDRFDLPQILDPTGKKGLRRQTKQPIYAGSRLMWQRSGATGPQHAA